MKKTSLLALLLTCAACSDASTGTLRVRANGEAAAVAGYPVTVDGETIGLVDGFTVTFTHLYVGLSDLRLETADGDSANLVVHPVTVDLSAGPSQIWEASVPARRWDRVSYRTTVPSHADHMVGDVDYDTVHVMLTNHYAFFATGTATDGDATFEFAFGFPPIEQSRCENGDGTEGIVITPNGVTEAEVTIHLDHLFFDSLAAEEPSMRFEPFAAAAIDGYVTNAFLDRDVTDIRARSGLPIMDGETVVVYDPGPYAISPMNLEQYLLAAGSTMGHWNGEGHCEYAPAEE